MMYRPFHRFVSACALAMLAAVSSAPGRAATPLRVASDVSYAPLEFFTPQTHIMKGFDIDLARALGVQLARPVQISNHNFADLLAAVKRGQFDLAISALSDTRKRETQVDFVDYLLAGTGMLVPAGNPKHIFNLGALCGLRVAVQKGTSQEIALKAQSEDCTAVNLGAMKLLLFATDDQAFAAFAAGKADVHVTDFPVVSYLARLDGNAQKYSVAGRQFAVVPYGIAIAKNNPKLRDQVQVALRALVANGTYAALLKKWGLRQGALRSAPINAGTLF